MGVDNDRSMVPAGVTLLLTDVLQQPKRGIIRPKLRFASGE